MPVPVSELSHLLQTLWGIYNRKVKKKILSILLLLFTFVLIEVAHGLWRSKLVYDEMMGLGSENQRFRAEVIDKICPLSSYKTRFACFLETSKKILDRKWDTAGNLGVLAIGITAISMDRKQNLSTKFEIELGLIEFMLDRMEPLLESKRPFSPFIVDILEREVFNKSIAELSGRIEKLLANFPKWPLLADFDPTLETRMKGALTKYELLKPLILEQTKRNSIDTFFVQMLNLDKPYNDELYGKSKEIQDIEANWKWSQRTPAPSEKQTELLNK